MKTDTHPDLLRKQYELSRQASVSKRLQSMISITSATVQLSRRAIARSHPDLSPAELDCLFVSLHYGPEITARFKRYLSRRHG